MLLVLLIALGMMLVLLIAQGMRCVTGLVRTVDSFYGVSK